MNQDRKTARVAGLWYLAIGVCYGFSMAYVDRAYFVSGNVVATVKNIQASGLLFQLGFASCLVGTRRRHSCFWAGETIYRPLNLHSSKLWPCSFSTCSGTGK
jgi:hypothetical protein